MAYGALTGDLYSMAMGTTPGQQDGISVPQGLTSRQGLEDRDEKEAKPAGTITPRQLSLDDGSSLQEAQASPMAGDQGQPKAMMSDIEASVASVSNQFALWFGDRYALSKEEQDLFEVMVSGSKDPVDTAGRYVASLALSKKTGMSIYEVYPRLDAISQYFTGETYRPNDATFSQKVNASFEAINISDLKGQWMRVVKEKGFDDPKAIALENEIFQREEAIGGIQNAIPTGFWDRVASGVLGSLGYTAEGIKYGAAASVGTAAVTSPMVAGVAAANPIAGLAAASSAALYAAFSGAVASFQRTGELAEYDTFWDMMHMTDAEGNLMHRDVAAATFYAGLNRNITGFLETMVDGVISKGVSSFAPVVLQRFGVPNLTVKVLADRGVSGLSSRLAYAGMDWLAGGLNEGFLQEGPEQLATAVLNAAYVKTVGGSPDLSLKQLASEYFHSSFEGMLVGLAYGGIGIPQAMSRYNGLSLDLRREANATPSLETYMDRTDAKKPEDVSQADYDSAREQIFNTARRQQAEWQAERFGGTVLESEEISQEELYTTANPETGEEEGIVPDGSIYRNPDDKTLFTETRKENGRTYVYAGDPNSKAAYGYAELSTDGDTLTVESVKVRPGYEGIREELVRKAISEERTGESVISWEPRTEGLKSVRDSLIRNNPRGEQAGLDYGADLSLNQDHDIETLSSTIRTAMPNLSREESVVAARLYSIADRDSSLTALNEGKPVQQKADLSSKYRGAADGAKAIIYAGKNADFSTFYHELFHVNATQRPSDARALSTAVSNAFKDDASRTNLQRFIEDSKEIWGPHFDSEGIMKSLEAIRADGDASTWSREQFENLARLAEAYAAAERSKQTALPEAIRTILAKIGEFMRKVYQTVRQTVPLQKEIMDAYDRLMYGGARTEAASEKQRAFASPLNSPTGRAIGLRTADDPATVAKGYDTESREVNQDSLMFQDGEQYQTTEERLKTDPANFNSEGHHLAPNGKSSNLSYEQWVTVRTPAFKEWFGDWEHAYRISKWLSNDNVLTIDPNAHSGLYELNWKSAKRYALDNLRGQYRVDDNGAVIELTRDGVSEIISENMGSELGLKLVAYIPDIIKNSIFVYAEENQKAKKSFDYYEYYLTDIDVDGNSYVVKSAVGVRKGRRYYTFNLSEVKDKGAFINSRPVSDIQPGRPTSQGSLSDIKDTRLLSILQADSSKVVDENGEPMVVYHGTAASPFRVFDVSGIGSWFTSSREAAESYGPDVYPVFLNMRNPAETDAMGNGADDLYSDLGFKADVYAIGADKPMLTFTDPRDFSDWIAETDLKNNVDYTLDIDEGNPMASFTDSDTFMEEANDGTHDGGIIRNVVDLGPEATRNIEADVFAVFNPEQVKSIDNQGTFDSSNPDIYMQDEHPVDYSGLTEDETRKKEETVSADQRYYDGDETALDDLADDFIDDAEAIQEAADAEYFSKMYSDYEAYFDKRTADVTDSLADENIPEYDPDGVNVKGDGTEAEGMADYEDDVNEKVIPSKQDDWVVEMDDSTPAADIQYSNMSEADIEAIMGSGDSLRASGVIDGRDTDITWKEFIRKNRPDGIVFEGNDGQKDDILVSAIQDDAILSRYLGIIGEALYLNTRYLNNHDPFIDQAQRERIKDRVYDTITSRVVRNAAGQLARGEGPLSPQRLASARKEISDNARLYRNALSILLNDDTMRPESLVSETRGLAIPSRETLDAMPISQLRELVKTARDAEIVSKIEHGSLKVRGDIDETRADEINSALKSLAEKVKAQQAEMRSLESANASLQSSLDALSSDIDERDKAIDDAIRLMRKTEGLLSSDASKLSLDEMEAYSFTDRMRIIRTQLRLLSPGYYEEIERRRAKGKQGITRDNAITAARNEYISEVLMTFPDILGSEYARKTLTGSMDRTSDTGFRAIRKIFDAKMDELRSEWKDEAAAYARGLSSSVRTKADAVSKGIDSALDRMARLEKDIERQKALRETIKENRRQQIRDARTEERWKAAKKALEREKRFNQELRNAKDYAEWKKDQQEARFLDEIRDIKGMAKEREAEIRESYRVRIDEMKAEQRARRKELALTKAIDREKAKLARAIMRPVNLNTTDYSVAEPIMAIQAIVDPHFRRDWVYDIRPDGEGTMTVDEAKGYLRTLSDEGRSIALSTLSPDLVARLTEQKRPLNDFTVYELRTLAQQVNLLRKQGREALAAKKEATRAISNEVIRSVIVAVRDRANKQGDALPGSLERLSKARSLKSTVNEGLYATWRPDELSQLLDGGFGIHGPARQVLIDEKRYHQDRENRAIDRRKDPINAMLTKDMAKRFFDKHTVDFGDIKMTLTNDNLAYIYLSQFNDETRDAVAYGSLLLEREKGTVTNKLVLENGEETVQFLVADNGAIADDAVLKDTGDRRYRIAVEYAENALEESGLMPVVKAIEADFNDPQNRERLQRASIDYFNKPMELVKYYLPIFRTDVKGNDFDNVTAGALFNLNTGEVQGSPEKGFTIPRIKNISPRHQRGVNLSLLSVWDESVRNQEHLIEFSGYVKKLYSIFNNRELNAMVNQAYSPGLMHEIQSYIKLIANPLALKDTGDKAVNKLLRTGRGRLTTAYLAWKLSGIVMQAATSPWPFLREINPVRLASAYMQLAAGRTKVLDDIWSKSSMMKHRSMDMILQEAMDRQRNITESSQMSTLREWEQKGMNGLEWVDRIAVAGGWLAKYQEQLEAGQGAGLDTATAEAAAIKAADDTVLAVQPSGDPTELPSLFRTRNEGLKALLQFQSSLSVIWNNMTADNIGYKRTRQYGKMLAGSIAYALAGITLGLAAEGFDDDDEGKDMARKLAYWALTQPIESVPIVGSTISSALQKAITGSADFYGSGFSLWPPVEKVSRGLQKILSKDPEGLYSIAEGAALFTGLPVSGFKQAMKAATGEPEALLGR